MVNLRDAVAECLFKGFERQRLVQVLTQMPRFDHSGEDIHEQGEIDEASFETDVGNICYPDLILMTDLKVFKQIAPRFLPPQRFCGLTRTLERYQEILLFHQSSDTAGANSVSLTHEQLRDTPIPVSRILSRKFLYFREQHRFGRLFFGVIIETAPVDTEDARNISHAMLLLQF